MNYFFKISSLSPLEYKEEGVVEHSFNVMSEENGRKYTFIVMNNGFDLSIIKEGDIIQFESKKKLSNIKEGRTIYFEIRPNLRTFYERDVIYRRNKDGKVNLMINPPNILTYPIVYSDTVKKRKRFNPFIIHISVEENVVRPFFLLHKK